MFGNICVKNMFVKNIFVKEIFGSGILKTPRQSPRPSEISVLPATGVSRSEKLPNVVPNVVVLHSKVLQAFQGASGWPPCCC